MRKAAREAKQHTSWIDPNHEFEAALDSFVRALFAEAEFMAELWEFVEPLIDPGRINSLAQKLIALTAPGVPDVYQGTELWDLSLVDPDNRRPVDFELRCRLLAEAVGMEPEEAWLRRDEGLPKLLLVQRALALRRELPQAFREGSYRPLRATGSAAEHVVAFIRAGAVIAVAPRLVLQLDGSWGDTTLVLPAGRWRDRFSNRAFNAGMTPLRDLLANFPVSLLSREDAA
jgi:(1->4)-alpha-D-glucan 1-alpha-D-glucosylmutase